MSIFHLALAALLLAPPPPPPPPQPIEVTPSGFEVTTIVLTQGDGAVAEPPAGPATNAQGDVLYAVTENGRDALYLRFTNGMRVRLLAAGDALAGSRVARVVSTPSGLDTYRQVLVYAVLEDGRAGLFRLSPPPSPFAVVPKWGNRSAPISFQLSGDGFVPGVEVFFGDTKAGFVTVISRTELTGVIPAGAPAGSVDVGVARPGMPRRTIKAAFEFRDAPTAGCQDLWPDHRPPQRTSMLLTPFAVAGVLVARGRRRKRRWRS